MSVFDDTDIPSDEIIAAADALRIMWESEANQTALRETGYGAGWLFQGRAALEAALSVRGRAVVEAPEGVQ